MGSRNNYMKTRLMCMSFFQVAVWGTYLISMGGYLSQADMGDKIGYFYAMQGIVSLFMPALMGVVADRWISAENGELSAEAAVVQLKTHVLFNQVSFHTNEALSQLRFVESIIVDK